MRWTKDKPTVEGWYWYESDTEDSSVVLVYQDGDGVMFMCGPEVNNIRLSDGLVDSDGDPLHGCQWSSEPLTPPTGGHAHE